MPTFKHGKNGNITSGHIAMTTANGTSIGSNAGGNVQSFHLSTGSSAGSFSGTFGPMSGSTVWPIDPMVQAELDRLQETLDAAVTKIEFLEVEAKYWHIKSDKFEKLLAKALNITE